MSKLAILGGEKAVKVPVGDMFHWPIVNKEMEDGVLDVLRKGTMSGTDITKEFEKQFAAYHGVKYALGHNTGTASLQAAFFGVGLGRGDEIICPATTYWASGVPALSLGTTLVFADIDPATYCLDPKDFEKRITERTKAVVVVHYCSYPAPMDEIMAIARKHNIKVIEDVSHAQGGHYKGQMLGTFGDVAAMSLMSGKSFAIGEAGILITNDQKIYERAVLWGHYERTSTIEDPELAKYAGMPCGGYKYRMHQLSSVVGLAQLKKYDAEKAEIDKAMNYFWEQLSDIPIDPHRPKDPGSDKAGWYCSLGIYDAEKMDGLSLKMFHAALKAEGVEEVFAGGYSALHLHPLCSQFDVYGDGKPTNFAFLPEGAKLPPHKPGDLPHSEAAPNHTLTVPWFKHFRKDFIDEYVAAFRKVYENRHELLKYDDKEIVDGGFSLSHRKN